MGNKNLDIFLEEGKDIKKMVKLKITFTIIYNHAQL